MPDSLPKVQSLSLENFTAFEKATFDFCPGINVLIGANATGKSHMMKIIYALLKECEVSATFPEALNSLTLLLGIFQSEKNELIRQDAKKAFAKLY